MKFGKADSEPRELKNEEKKKQTTINDLRLGKSWNWMKIRRNDGRKRANNELNSWQKAKGKPKKSNRKHFRLGKEVIVERANVFFSLPKKKRNENETNEWTIWFLLQQTFTVLWCIRCMCLCTSVCFFTQYALHITKDGKRMFSVCFSVTWND